MPRIVPAPLAPAPLVLGYHAVGPASRWVFSISPARLEAQVRAVLRRGLRPLTFGQLCATGADDVFAVTFDDGYRSALRLAAPLLERLGVPATMFAVVSYADAGRVGDARREDVEALSWDELRDLAARGWEIGSHTVSHPRLTGLGPEDLDRELRESKARIEAELGAPCPSLAYPYGDHDDRVVAAAAAAGYEHACVFPPTHAHRGPLAVPRVGVKRTDGRVRFALKTSPLVRRLLARRSP